MRRLGVSRSEIERALRAADAPEDSMATEDDLLRWEGRAEAVAIMRDMLRAALSSPISSEHIHEAADRVRRFLDARDGYFPIDVLSVVTRTGDRLLASDLHALVEEVNPDPVVARFEGFLIDARDKAWADGYNHAKVEMLSATNAPCFARGVDGEGNPNCRLASDHDGPHSDIPTAEEDDDA